MERNSFVVAEDNPDYSRRGTWLYDGANPCSKDLKWREIEDLPEDVRPLTNNELGPLHRIWMGRKDSLADRAALNEFHERLKREWAIETGIIEGVYVFDRERDYQLDRTWDQLRALFPKAARAFDSGACGDDHRRPCGSSRLAVRIHQGRPNA